MSLPVDEVLPELLARLRTERTLVLAAPPGAGKTTRVPRAMLEAGLAGNGTVLVVEPRRLAARMAARRVAQEAGYRVGETVGYQVRFDDCTGPATRLAFVTEGILGRRLVSDPRLRGVGAVVLDEFHERHLAVDVALALLRRLQAEARPDLRLLVMSATLDVEPLRAFLGCGAVLSEGRAHPVAVEHPRHADARPLATQVAEAVRGIFDEHRGDVLVFLPGAAEIRRAATACAGVAERAGVDVALLHGDLPAAAQDAAVRPGARRKVILSTNVAESSVTIEGVSDVVDSGLARVASFDAWSGLPRLEVRKISRASATQRAGRAGRTGPGRCVRLFTRHDFDMRPPFDTPEIARADLAETLLELKGCGIRCLDELAWLSPPPPTAAQAAEALLARLGAVDRQGRLTDLGCAMLRYPLHPRLARLVLEAGGAEAACIVAALLGERDVIAAGRFGGGGVRADWSGPSDLLDRLDRFREARRRGFDGVEGLDAGALRAVDRVAGQLTRIARGTSPQDEEASLLRAILAAFPDRVARRRGASLLLSVGGSARLSEQSVVREGEYLVAAEVDPARSAGVPTVRLASRIDPSWLLDLFMDRVAETERVEWNGAAERAEVVRRLAYDALVLDETRLAAPPSEAAAALLYDAARKSGEAALADPAEARRWLARVAFVAGLAPQAGLPSVGDDTLEAVLRLLCGGRTSLAELRGAMRGGGVVAALDASLSGSMRRRVEELAPLHVMLGRGRRVRVEYEAQQVPWIASRLQDFFGMARGPAVGGGRVPLQLRLLAPNGRPVQITTDLAGFWQRTYSQVRRELHRRYPRHAWPEDPLAFT